MTVQFILGRSGSGKTHYCLEAVKESLISSDSQRPLILLVPEQATFQMEQSLLADGRLKGYNRARVMSFERISRHILWETKPPALPPGEVIILLFAEQLVKKDPPIHVADPARPPAPPPDVTLLLFA